MACNPATPEPITTTLAGRTVPAEVVIIGIPLGTWAAPNSTALYPARLSWLELTSMDWARDKRRGIMSIEMSVSPALMHADTRSGWRKGSATHTIVVPSVSPSTSGKPTASTNGHALTSSAEPMVAPASMYSASSWLEARPAPDSTTTSKPAFESLRRLLGTMATRVSPFDSLGTPIRIGPPPPMTDGPTNRGGFFNTAEGPCPRKGTGLSP